MEESLNIGQQSVEIQKESMKIANRAYFSIAKIEPIRLEEFLKTKIKVRFLNSGQTPARKVESRLRIFFTKNQCPGLIKPLPVEARSEMVIGSNQTFFAERDRIFTESELQLIKDKKLFINIIGILEYFDIFDKKQILKYHLFYAVDKEGYTYCRDHNEAT